MKKFRRNSHGKSKNQSGRENIQIATAGRKGDSRPRSVPALSQHGLNIMEFVSQFNKLTAKLEEDMIIPVDIMVHADKTFTLKMKTPPASYLLKKAAGIMKGSGEPNKEQVAK